MNGTIKMELASETMVIHSNDNAVLADRKLFVHNLGEILKQTREGVVSCELDDNEVVTITYHGGGTHRTNVAADSYAAIIRDVAKALS